MLDPDVLRLLIDMMDRKEAEVSLLYYLKTLGQKRFVGFLVDGEMPKKKRGKK